MLFDPFDSYSFLAAECLQEIAGSGRGNSGLPRCEVSLASLNSLQKGTSCQGFCPRCGSNSHFRGRRRVFLLLLGSLDDHLFSEYKKANASWVKQWYTWLMASHNKSMRCTSKNNERLCLHVPLMDKLPSSDGSDTGQFTRSIYRLRESTWCVVLYAP